MDDRLAGCLPGWTLIVRWTYGLKDGRMDRWMDEWMHDSLLQLQLQFQLPLQLFVVLLPVVGWLLVARCCYLSLTNTRTHTHTNTHHTQQRHQESPKTTGR